MTYYDITYRITLYGEKGVGINTLTQHYLSRLFTKDTSLIIGGELYTKTIRINLKNIKLQVFHIKNEERFKLFWSQYIKGCNGVMVMYDITNSKSLNKLSEMCQLVKNELSYEPPILLVGNKLDLDIQREVSKEEVEKFKKQYGISCSMEISTKTGENVEDMFKKITEMIYERSQ